MVCIRMYPARMSKMSSESAFYSKRQQGRKILYRKGRTFAKSQNRMTRARAAYATHFPFLIWPIGRASPEALPESTSNLTPESSVNTLGVVVVIVWRLP